MNRVAVQIVTFSILIVFAALSAGCRGKQVDAVSNSGDQHAEADDGQADGSDRVTITEEEIATLRSNFKRVHFPFDRAELDATSREVLAENAQILLNHPTVKIRIEGHADRWGSDIYNLALGQRRAEAVQVYLRDLGVGVSQLGVISYGEERPLAPEGDREVEAPNRRAEFLVLVGGEVVDIKSSY